MANRLNAEIAPDQRYVKLKGCCWQSFLKCFCQLEMPDFRHFRRRGRDWPSLLVGHPFQHPSTAANLKNRRRARNRPEPAQELRDWEKQARARAEARPYPPGIILEAAGFDEEHWTAPHHDTNLWTLQLADAFGTRSQAVISAFMAQIEALQRPRTPNRTKRRSITVSKELHQHAHYLDARGAENPADNPIQRMP